MGLLSSLYQQQQQINQQPTSAIRTPIQTAYDNLLNAQSNAQNTAKEEWGSAIGNSVNGLAKIIASSVIGNPIEKAASTRNLDNFDARQDALVRQWAMEQAKKRNDFVNQAREQLGMAKADEEQAYNRDLTKQQIAYKKLQDELAQKNYEQEQEQKAQQRAEDVDFRERTFKWQQDEADRKRKDAYEQAQQEAAKQAVNKEEQKNVTEMQKSVSELQAQLNSFDKEIPELEQLNKESHMGAVERTISGIGGGLDNLFGVKDNKFIEPELKNQEKVARLRQKALGMLKTTFGGAVSEGERDAIFAQFGLDKDNMSYKEYENAIKLMRAYFQNKLNEKQETLDLYTNQNSVNWE